MSDHLETQGMSTWPCSVGRRLEDYYSNGAKFFIKWTRFPGKHVCEARGNLSCAKLSL